MGELDLEQRPQLTRPVLVASFRGWNDGGQGASMANAFLSRTWHAEKFASIDSENFFDFQSTRPHVSLVEGSVRRIDWPENVFEHARPARSDRDAVLLLGTEPGLRWRHHPTDVSSAHPSGIGQGTRPARAAWPV